MQKQTRFETNMRAARRREADSANLMSTYSRFKIQLICSHDVKIQRLYEGKNGPHYCASPHLELCNENTQIQTIGMKSGDLLC